MSDSSKKRYRNWEGHSCERLYHVWYNMKQRCENPSHMWYCNYGGRGIRVCSEWQNYLAFRKWAYASGYKEDAPQGECTIDRIDNGKGYCPENCHWISMKEQLENRRPRQHRRDVLSSEQLVSFMDWVFGS